jgi:hypothetical protein
MADANNDKSRLSVFSAPGHEMRFFDLRRFIQKAMMMDMPDEAVVTASNVDGCLAIRISDENVNIRLIDKSVQDSKED